MTTQEIIDVLKAYQEGKEIEFLQSDGRWSKITNPLWDFHCYSFRIKPTPKIRKFKLIKDFPQSPSLNTIVEFKSEKDMEEGLDLVGALSPLILTDCTNYPEFWEECTKDDNLVGKICIHKSGGYFYVITAQGTEFLQLSNEVTGEQLTISYNNFNQHYKLC